MSATLPRPGEARITDPYGGRGRQTPTQNARARRAPALQLPPLPPPADRRRSIDKLQLEGPAGKLRIGSLVLASPNVTAGLRETAQITIPVDDSSGLVREMLTDGLRGVDGIRLVVDGIVYVVAARSGGDRLTLTVEDEVAWRLRLFASFRAWPRSRFTRAQAFRELVREAGSKPMPPIRAWIPELRDRQRVATPTLVEGDGGPTTDRGTSRGDYKVKGEEADEQQRRAINAILTECRRLNCSRRVMIATIMCATQESVIRPERRGDAVGPDSRGYYQQRAAWGPESVRRNATLSTRMFLTGGRGGQAGWKQKHGSLRVVPGGFEAAIKAVQISVGGYAQWEAEATRTVDEWLGDGAGSGGDVEARVYEYTRGTREGERETSFAASGRWAEEVNWFRWVMLNTACWASGDELRAGAPAMSLDGDEPWLLSPLEPDMAADRPVDQLDLAVLSERWGLLPGACVTIPRSARIDVGGRWLVSYIDGPLYGSQWRVTLERPASPRLEPAVESAAGGDSEESSLSTESAGSAAVYAAARRISAERLPYVWGGGHASAGTPDRGTGRDPGIGYDCSGSCGAALAAAGLGFRPGDRVPASGWFAANWGKAGKGKRMTVWANATHMWIEWHGRARDGHRFDTSPYGSGPRGPQLRTQARPSDGFTPRHWPGT